MNLFTHYYTSWSLLLFTSRLARFTPKGLEPSITAMLVVSSVGGWYVAYVRPKKMMVLGYRITGMWLKVGDLLFHHLPLAWALSIHESVRPNRLLPFALISSAYLLLHDVRPRYGLRYNPDMVRIMLGSSVVLGILCAISPYSQGHPY